MLNMKLNVRIDMKNRNESAKQNRNATSFYYYAKMAVVVSILLFIAATLLSKHTMKLTMHIKAAEVRVGLTR